MRSAPPFYRTLPSLRVPALVLALGALAALVWVVHPLVHPDAEDHSHHCELCLVAHHGAAPTDGNGTETIRSPRAIELPHQELAEVVFPALARIPLARGPPPIVLA